MNSKIKSQQVMVLAAGMFIFTLGFGVIVPVMPYYASDLGATAFDLGLLMATFSVMQFVCAPFWGALSDRIGRKPVIMVGLLGFATSFIITGFSSHPVMLSISETIGQVTGLSPHIGVLFISELIGGTLSAGIFPAILAFIADITKPEERGSLMGLMGAASGLGIIFGPALSGFVASAGITVPFFAAAGIALANAALSFVLLPESRVPGPVTEAPQKIGMINAVRSSLGIIFLLTLFISFAGAFIDSTFAYFVMDKFHMKSEVASPIPALHTSVMLTGPGVMGVVFTAMGIIGVLCQGLLVGKMINRFGEHITILIGLMLSGIGLLLLLESMGLVSLVLFTCLISIGFGLVNPSLNTLVSKKTDAENQGAMLGVLGSFNSLGRAIGPPVGGLLYSVAMWLPYVVSAAIGVIAAGVLYVSQRGEGPAVQQAEPAHSTK